eukprot:1016134-Prymnesium_polylepis.1
MARGARHLWCPSGRHRTSEPVRRRPRAAWCHPQLEKRPPHRAMRPHRRRSACRWRSRREHERPPARLDGWLHATAGAHPHCRHAWPHPRRRNPG